MMKYCYIFYYSLLDFKGSKLYTGLETFSELLRSYSSKYKLLIISIEGEKQKHFTGEYLSLIHKNHAHLQSRNRDKGIYSHDNSTSLFVFYEWKFQNKLSQIF